MKPSVTHRPRFWLLAAGLFLVIATARIGLVLHGLPEMPVYDQWSVIDGIALPLASGNFDPAYLIAPHNEHVLFWTKLLDWVQLRLGAGQIDARPAGLLIALVYAASAAALLAGAAHYVTIARLPLLISGIALSVLPYAWENITEAWGNPYLLLIVGAVGTLFLAAHAQRVGAIPALLLAVVFSLLAMGSGWVAPALAIAIVAARLRNGDLPRDLAAAMLAVLLAGLALAALLLVRQLQPAARAPAHLLLSVFQIALATVVFLPSLRLAAHTWRAAPVPTPAAARADAWVSMLGVWGCLHVVAMIAARPEFRLWFPFSRYMDILSVAMLANLACALELAARNVRWFDRGVATSAVRIFAAVTLLAAPLPLGLYAWQVERWSAAQAIVASSIHGAGAAAIERGDTAMLPFPDREYLKAHLADARVRRILGDRIGDRPDAAAFVAASRRLESWIGAKAPWLITLAVLGGAALSAAAFRPAQRQAPGREPVQS